MSKAFHTAYRPVEFDDVTGQDGVIKGLRALLGRDTSHAFMFSGPSGVGKTTLARITAAQCNVPASNILEFDASTNTGVEDIRNLQQELLYRPFGGGNKAIIVDEAHGLTKNAWNALLKATEEPPEWVYFFLCTTEPSKVPKNIQTRFSKFALNPVPVRKLVELLTWVCSEEGIKLHPDILLLCAEEADGSPREALVNLAEVTECKTEKEAAEVLASARTKDSKEIRDLCQYILNGKGTWQTGMSIIDKLAETNPESVRIVTMNYLAAVAKNAKTDSQAIRIIRMMEAFATPYNNSDGKAALVLSVGRCLYSD